MKLFKKKASQNSSARHPRLMSGQETNSFRRSRTLTGSTSSGVGAANEQRGRLQSERLKKQQLKHHQRQLLVGLAILIATIAGLYYLLSQYTVSVRTIQFQPAALSGTPQDEQYKQAILGYLQAKPAQRFRFALSNTELTRSVAQHYPEVESIKVVGGAIGTGDFVMTLRQPIVVWKINNKQYFVDSGGETFERSDTVSPAVNVLDNSGASLTQGNLVASRGFLRFLGRLVALTNESGLGQVSQLSLPPNTTREVDIKLTNRNFIIKTHTDRDPAAEVEDMKRVIGYLDQRKINVSYIDLRVNGRAYYR